MGERHGLGMSEFEVLDRLAESGCSASAAQELADSVHLSQSALSRLIARLEKDGLVERFLCAEDRRGIYVSLTPGGRDRHAAAAPTHREVLASVLPAAARPVTTRHPYLKPFLVAARVAGHGDAIYR